jgi:hypothetical protein
MGQLGQLGQLRQLGQINNLSVLIIKKREFGEWFRQLGQFLAALVH